MNLNDHAVRRKVELAPKKEEITQRDFTRTAIAEGYDVNILDKPIECSVNGTLSMLGLDCAAAFTTKELISKSSERPTALGEDNESILFAACFIRKLTATYIGSNHTVPCQNRGGFKEGVQRLLTTVANTDGTYGDNHLPQGDINDIFNKFDEHDVDGEPGNWYGLRHWIYLPITNLEINVDISDFHSFSPNDQTALRTAKMASLSRTYVTIILKDGTQFILWPSESQFGIVAAYPKGK